MLTAFEQDIIDRVSKADQDGVIYITAEEFVKLHSGKNISLEHHLDAHEKTEWVYRNSPEPIKLDGDKLTIGNKEFDATHIELITRYGINRFVPDDNKHVLGFMTILMAYGDPDRPTSFERGNGYTVYYTLCRAWALQQFNGYFFNEKYAVAECGTVLTLHRNKHGSVKGGKQWATPLRPGCYYKEGKPSQYYTVTLTDKTGKQITINLHKLIATMFVPNPDPLNYVHVNHRDLNSHNNSAENLEWCTPAYNSKYSPVVRALKKALPDIDCHEWLDEAHDITEAVLQGEDRAELVGKAVRKIIVSDHLASVS